MSKSYRGWAELEDWGAREARRQHKRKSEQDWKAEAMAEIEDTATPTSVYAIINEWDDDNGNGSEILGGWFFWSDDEAWERLALVAEANGVDLEPDVTSLTLRDDMDAFEAYYITELTAYLED